jgi:phosphate transport system substrate-binding protein
VPPAFGSPAATRSFKSITLEGPRSAGGLVHEAHLSGRLDHMTQGAFIMKSHVSAIDVFVSKANPIDQIPLDKLDAIYSDARRRGYPADITTWGQLGLTGEWANRPIHIYGFYGRDDVTWYFRDMVSYDAAFKSSYRVPGDNLMRRTPVVAHDLMTTLENDPGAIGFANFSCQSDGVKALALVDEHGVISQPVLEDILTGRYALQRALYIYVHRKPGAPLTPLEHEFLEYILSKEGQSVVQLDHCSSRPSVTPSSRGATH